MQTFFHSQSLRNTGVGPQLKTSLSAIQTTCHNASLCATLFACLVAKFIHRCLKARTCCINNVSPRTQKSLCRLKSCLMTVCAFPFHRLLHFVPQPPRLQTSLLNYWAVMASTVAASLTSYHSLVLS